jgi:hypothetical protein
METFALHCDKPKPTFEHGDGAKLSVRTSQCLASKVGLFCKYKYYIIIKSGRMRWAGHVARMGEKKSGYRISVGNPEGKRPLGRQRRRWVDDIRMELREDGMVWIGLIWLRIGISGGLL